MLSPTSGWENFFVAEAGAAAALSGLVFVAVSISLQQILPSQYLRGRAIETLLTFMCVLAVATCGLIPDQSAAALGAEIATFGALLCITAARRHLEARRDPALHEEARRWMWLRLLGAQASGLPFVAAGLLLAAGNAHALALIAPGVLTSFAAGALNAWVLLVEIQR